MYIRQGCFLKHLAGETDVLRVRYVVRLTSSCIVYRIIQKKGGWNLVLFRNEYCWTSEDAQHDVIFSFSCPTEIQEVRISFSFSPAFETEKSICLPRIEDALGRYYDSYSRALQPMESLRFLPIKNLITLSVSKDGKYLGNAHRWEPEQEHVFTAVSASRGFVAPEKLSGEWSGMLHLHEIISPQCKGTLYIEGRSANDLVSS